jgi:hypothetical protein
VFYRKRILKVIVAFLLLKLMWCCPSVLAEEKSFQQVRVVEPFIELRTGPGEGYPVFHATEAGEWLQLLLRKTNWLRVRDSRGREGWVRVADIRLTVNADNQLVTFDDPQFDVFSSRRWEAGVMAGDFDGATLMQVYGGYWWTEYWSTEAAISQITGNSSEITLLNASLLHQPFPAWRVSPYFTLGAGTAVIRPKSTLVDVESRNEESVHFGVGARLYLSDRYFVRLEYKDYVVFTDRDQNEEAQEWKIGLSVFF